MLMSRVDHCGNLAYLNSNNGFNGRILGTNQTLEVAKELIEDTLNIHIKNIEKLKYLGRKTRPLYTKQDMFDMFEKMEVVPSYKKITLNEWVTIEFVNALHCLGSSMIHLWIKKPNQNIFHIIISGDIVSEQNKLIHPLAEKREQITKCNLFISEATYNKKKFYLIDTDSIDATKMDFNTEIKMQAEKELMKQFLLMSHSLIGIITL